MEQSGEEQDEKIDKRILVLNLNVSDEQISQTSSEDEEETERYCVLYFRQGGYGKDLVKRVVLRLEVDLAVIFVWERGGLVENSVIWARVSEKIPLY